MQKNPKTSATITKKPENKGGRPTKYTPEMGNRICEIISTSSLGLSQISIDNDFPHVSTIRKWILKFDEFRDNYARAKLIQASIFAEECIEIADNSKSESVHVDRLRIDTRKWIASKLLPKQYGDRMLLEQKTEENDQLKAELIALRAKLDEENKREF